ncbi:NAD(P)/FAD-dependent oxidoreductase [Actinokineospora enzanensis]|uniref:NAD(P)/FAD-dependent oxidoreductase n=1 Tax=Actinokineospora enzanensis TaxID=155975 RepID=UPI00037E089E|nr:NAD(P)/FAD-dependent oxidoreductase [Actinokineospora enzanensis]
MTTNHTTDLDILVVGGGAAGLSAALLLARARRRVAVVDGGRPRNAPAAHMHGFLSRDGVPPARLLAAGRVEVTGYGADVIDAEVDTLARRDDGSFIARLDNGRTLRSRSVLVATGLRDELPDIPGVRERWGRDVLHCPYCHGHEVRDRPVGVLGTGPAAVFQAQLVRQWSADTVLFAHTLDIATTDRRRLDARGIAVVEGLVAGLDIHGDALRGVTLATGEIVPREAVFLPPRMIPRDALLTGLGCAVDDGWVRVDGAGRTSVPGVVAVGNVVDPRMQVLTAAGMAAAAAGMLNADLIEQDITDAMAHSADSVESGAVSHAGQGIGR